ncbi:hypothetical protein BDV19DRAFT_247638 [Aspergillus venezuelensis]
MTLKAPQVQTPVFDALKCRNDSQVRAYSGFITVLKLPLSTLLLDFTFSIPTIMQLKLFIAAVFLAAVISASPALNAQNQSGCVTDFLRSMDELKRQKQCHCRGAGKDQIRWAFWIEGLFKPSTLHYAASSEGN